MAEQPKVYVVHLSINELLRGTNQSSKGNALTGLWVRGTVVKDGATETWEKFLMDWNAAEPIAAIEQAGVGARVDIRMLKEGRFWNIQSVTNMGQAEAEAPPPVQAPAQAPAQAPPVQEPQEPQEPPQRQQSVALAPAPAPAQAKWGQYVPSASELKVIAMNKATDLTIGMMANGILKGAKVTPQIVYEGVIVLADRIAEYFENGAAADPKSDTSPLQREPGCDDDDPGQCADDDIPF